MLCDDALTHTKKWRKPVRNIQVIGAERNKKMKLYEQKGYSEKEALNIRTEEQKLSYIEFLKKQKPPGPFTSSNQVSDYLGCDHNDEKTVNSPCFRLGDYVAALWIDDNDKHEWFLANVVETCNSDTVLLSY